MGGQEETVPTKGPGESPECIAQDVASSLVEGLASPQRGLRVRVPPHPPACPAAEALGAVPDAGQRLGPALDEAIGYGPTSRLAAAMQGLAAIESGPSLVAAIPELALLACAAAGAALLKVKADGSVESLAHAGAPFRSPQPDADEAGRRALRDALRLGSSGGPSPLGPARLVGPLVAIPLELGKDGTALVLERADGAGGFAASELERLRAYGSLASTALARARMAASLQQAAARDAAILGAIPDGVLAVDREGVVRAVNTAAARLLGVRLEDLLGRRLRSIPELCPVANALALAQTQETARVPLPRGELVVRARLHDGGIVALLRDAPAEHLATHRLAAAAPVRYTFADLVGESPAFLRAVEEARSAARCEVPILICGESGTGKELFAQAIHAASRGAGAPFIGINVAAIPRELLESELFGYEAGAFTGALAGGRPGKFELAGSGTILLDEIGEMPLEMQSKLLRVLQERTLQRLGGARDVRLRARIVATTHRNLYEAVQLGKFRLDLFHRLCVLHLSLPPLRERPGDVAVIVQHLLRAHAEASGRRVRIAPQVLSSLEAYDWPGNVRQLANVIEGELSMLGPGQDELTRIPPALQTATARTDASCCSSDEVLPLEEMERRACEHALLVYKGNVARAAQALGLAKGTLYAKVKRYGIRVSDPCPTPRPGSLAAVPSCGRPPET